ncbi:hypothetical protein BT96DRAFT_999183 [Gymnopus androsaceus JB14]|uniref:GST N-terminal domain-containing protein n=1 Tax=Gymnopus androsaceus JB14 TaxID=1447944 RepID=A0A6A4H6B5_9AGAR|nr:hypothetical protein BT96DRAFT_999183 [Gymnopus androsaceus JB14]
MKEIGAKPTGLQPLYTLLAIIDDSTGVVLAESTDIVEYLDKTYPDLDLSRKALMLSKPHSEMLSTPSLLHTTLRCVDAWMKKDDVWVMGDTPLFADFILASFILSP